MKQDANRHGRKDRQTQRAARRRRRSSVRWAALFAALACLALGSIPAEAGTGGASAVSSDGSSGKLVFSSPMRSAGATWYGPGLYGNHTACGQILRPSTIGVAHRKLPCGTAIKFAYHGKTVVARVIDRGPYTKGNAFDLTNGARRALDFEGVNRVRYAIAIGSKSG